MKHHGTKAVTVSQPDDAQLLQAVRLAFDFWDESPVYRTMTKDLDRMIKFAYSARTNPSSFVHVALDGDQVCGFIVGEMAPYGFHNSFFAYDRMLYVVPTRRGGAGARRLIAAFEDWCATKNVSRIMLGITTGIKSERIMKLYNALGYTTVGALTMKEMN